MEEEVESPTASSQQLYESLILSPPSALQTWITPSLVSPSPPLCYPSPSSRRLLSYVLRSNVLPYSLESETVVTRVV